MHSNAGYFTGPDKKSEQVQLVAEKGCQTGLWPEPGFPKKKVRVTMPKGACVQHGYWRPTLEDGYWRRTFKDGYWRHTLECPE